MKQDGKEGQMVKGKPNEGVRGFGKGGAGEVLRACSSCLLKKPKVPGE